MKIQEFKLHYRKDIWDERKTRVIYEEDKTDAIELGIYAREMGYQADDYHMVESTFPVAQIASNQGFNLTGYKDTFRRFYAGPDGNSSQPYDYESKVDDTVPIFSESHTENRSNGYLNPYLQTLLHKHFQIKDSIFNARSVTNGPVQPSILIDGYIPIQYGHQLNHEGKLNLTVFFDTHTQTHVSLYGYRLLDVTGNIIDDSELPIGLRNRVQVNLITNGRNGADVNGSITIPLEAMQLIDDFVSISDKFKIKCEPGRQGDKTKPITTLNGFLAAISSGEQQTTTYLNRDPDRDQQNRDGRSKADYAYTTDASSSNMHGPVEIINRTVVSDVIQQTNRDVIITEFIVDTSKAQRYFFKRPANARLNVRYIELLFRNITLHDLSPTESIVHYLLNGIKCSNSLITSYENSYNAMLIYFRTIGLV
jgi:hypothetical protein